MGEMSLSGGKALSALGVDISWLEKPNLNREYNERTSNINEYMELKEADRQTSNLLVDYLVEKLQYVDANEDFGQGICFRLVANAFVHVFCIEAVLGNFKVSEELKDESTVAGGVLRSSRGDIMISEAIRRNCYPPILCRVWIW